MGCFVVARFVLTSTSHSPSAIAELLVDCDGSSPLVIPFL